jgi:hypothetical protein
MIQRLDDARQVLGQHVDASLDVLEQDARMTPGCLDFIAEHDDSIARSCFVAKRSNSRFRSSLVA